MLRRLGDALRVRYWTWQRDRSFRRWQLAHPGGSFAQFYADDAGRRSQEGGASAPHTLGSHLDPIRQRARAQSLLQYLRWAGCRPEHLLVDFGCGSLWIGETVMAYLQPGRYVGMDVVDSFHAAALARLGPEFVARHQPRFELISPVSLAAVRALRPDFIISTAVLQHVPPEELAGYFRQLVSLCTSSTRVFVGHKPSDWTRVSGPRSLQYSRADIAAALGGLGYEPRFARSPEAPPCVIALLEIVPHGRGGPGAAA